VVLSDLYGDGKLVEKERSRSRDRRSKKSAPGLRHQAAGGRYLNLYAADVGEPDGAGGCGRPHGASGAATRWKSPVLSRAFTSL